MTRVKIAEKNGDTPREVLAFDSRIFDRGAILRDVLNVAENKRWDFVTVVEDEE